MGRLVYVREVSERVAPFPAVPMDADTFQDREAEPRFIGSTTGGRGGFGGGMQGGMQGGGMQGGHMQGGMQGGFQGGYGGGGGFGGGGPGGPGRQIYIANVGPPPPRSVACR
ncbi:hypothetical protein IMZ48_27155 [Candidatus Bathyarchaeota archaeon]|nr:hypothetical protein [Candidatus Bathyarchaeota archaeon]